MDKSGTRPGSFGRRLRPNPTNSGLFDRNRPGERIGVPGYCHFGAVFHLCNQPRKTSPGVTYFVYGRAQTPDIWGL
jgi:hypothetical protein